MGNFYYAANFHIFLACTSKGNNEWWVTNVSADFTVESNIDNMKIESLFTAVSSVAWGLFVRVPFWNADFYGLYINAKKKLAKIPTVSMFGFIGYKLSLFVWAKKVNKLNWIQIIIALQSCLWLVGSIFHVIWFIALFVNQSNTLI